jgi:2'-hydroxyisoflavone reductase
MRVLILGGTRFIGRHIASTLKSEGHGVAVFHRGSAPLQELSGIEEILGEKRELPGFRDEFRRFRPDAVIDRLGYTPSDGAKIVETFKGWLERLVFLSSCDAIGRTPSCIDRPMNRSKPLDASHIRNATGFF